MNEKAIDIYTRSCLGNHSLGAYDEALVSWIVEKKGIEHRTIHDGELCDEWNVVTVPAGTEWAVVSALLRGE